MKEVPCIRLSHLTESQKRAYVIADNKLALNAGWDDELLALEIKDLQELDFDVSLLGFSEDELSAINEAANKNFEAATEEEQGKLDQLDPKWIDCPHCGKEFDARKS
jgi:ParB-like chromosome segregation protein Spo0J